MATTDGAKCWFIKDWRRHAARNGGSERRRSGRRQVGVRRAAEEVWGDRQRTRGGGSRRWFATRVCRGSARTSGDRTNVGEQSECRRTERASGGEANVPGGRGACVEGRGGRRSRTHPNSRPYSESASASRSSELSAPPAPLPRAPGVNSPPRRAAVVSSSSSPLGAVWRTRRRSGASDAPAVSAP